MNKDLHYFLSRTTQVNECLEWNKALNSDGYPRALYNGSANGKVHRIVYSLCNPEEDISQKVIRHVCDNIKCIRPEHLLSGTSADNMRDRDTRERHTLAAFKAKDIIVIRQLYDTGQYKQKELAKLFNVNSRTIQQIVRRTSYRWVP